MLYLHHKIFNSKLPLLTLYSDFFDLNKIFEFLLDYYFIKV